MRAAAAVAEEDLTRLGWTERHADTIAIGPGIGGELADYRRECDSGVGQGFTKNLLLQTELGGVVGVLVMAASALAEVRARCEDAIGRRNQDLGQLGLGEAALLFGQLNGNGLAGKSERDEDRLALKAAKAVAAVYGFFENKRLIEIHACLM